jgi:Fe-S oxidoreductase
VVKQVIFALMLLTAFGAVTVTILRYASYAALGVSDPRPRIDQIPLRLWNVLVYFLGQKKVAEPQIGKSASSYHHLFIFWGFLIIQIGAVELFIHGLWPVFNLGMVLGHTIYSGVRFVIDLSNLIVLVMIGYGFFRRIVLKPRLIPINLDASIVLGAIATLMVTHFGHWAFEALGEGKTVVESQPVSTVIAGLFAGSVSASTAHTVGEVLWWTHAVTIFSFLNYLPFSKHIHLLGALPNIATMNLSDRKMDLPKVDLEDENQWGVGRFEQFSWKSLIDTYACTECARCSNYCPANLTDKPLSPMDLIHDVRYEMLDKGPLLQEIRRLEATPDYDWRNQQLEQLKAQLEEMPPMVGGRIKEETLWSCTTCGACQEACPVFIEHPLKIIQMRQNLVLAQEKVPSDLARAFRNIERNSNPWGIGADQRMDWAEGLEVPTIEDKPNPEYILWVGCAGAFDQRIRKQTQAMVKILNAAKVDYAVLGHSESCTGDPARRGGNEMLFQMQAEQNITTLNEAKAKKVITSCPHCLHTLKNDYPQFGGNYEVIHHTQLITHLLEAGKLKPQANGAAKLNVTYHDSCYLGRWNGEYEAPRKALKLLPVVGQLSEPERAKAKGFCCGAGGGRMFMEEHGKRVNVNRTEELVGTGATTIAVACPFCNVMMTDGVKAMDKEEAVKVLDIAEIVAQALPALSDDKAKPAVVAADVPAEKLAEA